MLAVGNKVKVLFSECKGFGATKVGAIGTIVKVDAPIFKVAFPDGCWYYLERELTTNKEETK